IILQQSLSSVGVAGTSAGAVGEGTGATTASSPTTTAATILLNGSRSLATFIEAETDCHQACQRGTSSPNTSPEMSSKASIASRRSSIIGSASSSISAGAPAT